MTFSQFGVSFAPVKRIIRRKRAPKRKNFPPLSNQKEIIRVASARCWVRNFKSIFSRRANSLHKNVVNITICHTEDEDRLITLVGETNRGTRGSICDENGDAAKRSYRVPVPSRPSVISLTHLLIPDLCRGDTLGQRIVSIAAS